MARILFNLMFVDEGPLTGPGYYAVQLFENMLPLSGPDSVQALVQDSALHHFSKDAQREMVICRRHSGRFSRVLHEQLVLPFVSQRHRADILFSPAFVSPFWGATRLVVTICDMYYRVIPAAVEPFQRKYWQVMIPASSRACDLVLTISDSSKTDIEHFLPSARGKTLSIPLASRFKAAEIDEMSVSDAVREATREPFILMVANLTANKNCSVVTDAIARLASAGRKLRFIHAGKDHLGLLADGIKRHGIQHLALSLGKVSDDELVFLYKACLGVVVPSLYEGFGMPAVEAQAMGAPLVCSDRGALPEAGGDGALFFDPENPDQLVVQLRVLMDQSLPERQALIARGHASEARFSWERTARETLAAFRTLLAK